jgi:hypothetical protein
MLINSPQLWNSIRTSERAGYPGVMKDDAVRQFLDRSGSLPLTVSICGFRNLVADLR